MGCSKHFLGIKWERHNWIRQVNHTASRSFRESDQWGRAILEDHVVCHAQYVCVDCGAVRDGEECGCDQARADQCPVRLAWLAKPENRNTA